MQHRNLSVLAAFVLGVAITGATVSLWPQTAPQAALTPPSATPLTDALGAYQCRKAETKHIVMGGIEDSFSPGGDERAAPGALAEYMAQNTGSKGGIATGRDYDEPGQDRLFAERFVLPRRIAHGMVAVRQRHQGGGGNDYIQFGDIVGKPYSSHVATYTFEPSRYRQGWTVKGQVLSADLSDLPFFESLDANSEVLPKAYTTLLEFLRDRPETLDMVASDDTEIDAVGFAVCTEPEIARGTTFIVEALAPNIVIAGCNPLSRVDHCNVYAGDTLCTDRRPLACFSDAQAGLPNVLMSKYALLKPSWSGGILQFTAPIRGDRFQTSDEAHAYCAAKFGSEYRMATTHDGFEAHSLVARTSSTPEAPFETWIDSNLETYGNCWSLRPAYGSDPS